MNEKTMKFIDRFVKRVKGNPPGTCPLAVQLSFLQSARNVILFIGSGTFLVQLFCCGD